MISEETTSEELSHLLNSDIITKMLERCQEVDRLDLFEQILEYVDCKYHDIPENLKGVYLEVYADYFPIYNKKFVDKYPNYKPDDYQKENDYVRIIIEQNIDDLKLFPQESGKFMTLDILNLLQEDHMENFRMNVLIPKKYLDQEFLINPRASPWFKNQGCTNVDHHLSDPRYFTNLEIRDNIRWLKYEGKYDHFDD